MAELAVALDFPDAGRALEFSRIIQGRAPWVKVGLELFTAWGPSAVSELKDLGFKVFLDLKFMDIPNTVRGAVRASAGLGCDMLTVHALGGERMMQAAVEGAGLGAPGKPPLLVGVTVLTSMRGGDLPLAAGESLEGLVTDLAKRAKASGLDGVGDDFICVTPGIRPVLSGDDQRRTATPAEAVKAGADLLVVGRPVTGSASPRDELIKILEQMG
jgi:orotidine-5'-phosphate decarboxylase